MAPRTHDLPLRALADSLSGTYPRAEVQQQLESLRQHGAVVDDPELWLRTALARRFKRVPIEEVRQCCCGSGDHVRLCRFVFWNLLALRECRGCGSMFVSPRLTPAAMARIFDEDYFDPTNAQFWGRRRLPVFADVLRLLRGLGCRSVFDVGAAYGHFVQFASRNGLRAAGCDVSRTAVAWGREHLGVEVHAATIDEVDLPEGSFDAVASLDALYHSPDPRADLRAMRRLVAPGGVVVLRLRNGWKTQRRALREGRKEIGREPLPAGHLWAFTPRSIGVLAARVGLEVVLVEPAAYSRTPARPLQALWTRVDRAASARGLSRIRTQSFNVVLRRPAPRPGGPGTGSTPSVVGR